MLFESQFHDLLGLLPWVASHRAKQVVRNIDAQRRRILTPDEVKEASEKVVARIEQFSRFQDARTVMIYYPVHNEIDLRALVRKYADDKVFLFPALTHHKHDLVARRYEHHTPFLKGRYGIPEPSTPAYEGKIDLMIIPGMSFDKRHWRVGRGGGYYDRFIKRYPLVYKLGVGYDFQLHDKVPHWIFDKRVDHVFTPSQSI